jgi:ribosomal protein L29
MTGMSIDDVDEDDHVEHTNAKKQSTTVEQKKSDIDNANKNNKNNQPKSAHQKQVSSSPNNEETTTTPTTTTPPPKQSTPVKETTTAKQPSKQELEEQIAKLRTECVTLRRANRKEEALVSLRRMKALQKQLAEADTVDDDDNGDDDDDDVKTKQKPVDVHVDVRPPDTIVCSIFFL